MATAARKSDFISLARQEARRLWGAYQNLLSMQSEWNAQDYSNTLETGDFVGENEGLDATAIGAVVFDTVDAIKSDMDSGHATNMTNIL